MLSKSVSNTFQINFKQNNTLETRKESVNLNEIQTDFIRVSNAFQTKTPLKRFVISPLSIWRVTFVSSVLPSPQVPLRERKKAGSARREGKESRFFSKTIPELHWHRAQRSHNSMGTALKKGAMPGDEAVISTCAKCCPGLSNKKPTITAGHSIQLALSVGQYRVLSLSTVSL